MTPVRGLQVAMADYEIRLFKADGSLSIILVLVAIGAFDARAQALVMLKEGMARAEIWTGITFVETVYIDDIIPN
jgi:hypothetical protein